MPERTAGLSIDGFPAPFGVTAAVPAGASPTGGCGDLIVSTGADAAFLCTEGARGPFDGIARRSAERDPGREIADMRDERLLAEVRVETLPASAASGKMQMMLIVPTPKSRGTRPTRNGCVLIKLNMTTSTSANTRLRQRFQTETPVSRILIIIYVANLIFWFANSGPGKLLSDSDGRVGHERIHEVGSPTSGSWFRTFRRLPVCTARRQQSRSQGIPGCNHQRLEVAKAWFQDALDPGNANIKSLIAIIEEPPNSGGNVTQRYASVDVFGGAS